MIKARRWGLVLVALLGVLSFNARAELTIEISKGVDNPTPIAIVPFAWAGPGPLPEDLAGIVDADLYRCGQFRPVSRTSMLSRPSDQSQVFYRDWRAVGADFLVVGKVTQVAGPKPYQLQFELFDVVKQQRMIIDRAAGDASQMRDIAHYVSDVVYEKITGVRGAFSTKILYVAAQKRGRGQFNFKLYRADADGAREKLILESSEPLLSPTWSPDAQQIAYVSFENRRPGIYRQHLATGRREKLTGFPGINSGPAWSPDGQRMAMVLSKDGNPEIYVMDLRTRALTSVAPNRAIDTEPQWMPDGKSIIFTSDRGGKPQIYQVTLANGWVERLTFDGSYNARGRLTADGKAMVMVHQEYGDFHIAMLDLVRGRTQILTSTSLDESPSIAPNASMVMYATQRGGQGILAAVSIDGRVKYFLPSKERDVREPSWSPFLTP